MPLGDAPQQHRRLVKGPWVRINAAECLECSADHPLKHARCAQRAKPTPELGYRYGVKIRCSRCEQAHFRERGSRIDARKVETLQIWDGDTIPHRVEGIIRARHHMV